MRTKFCKGRKQEKRQSNIHIRSNKRSKLNNEIDSESKYNGKSKQVAQTTRNTKSNKFKDMDERERGRDEKERETESETIIFDEESDRNCQEKEKQRDRL